MPENAGTTTLIVVDDQTLFREMLAGYLRQEDWLDVVAQGESGTDAVTLARRHRPGIALLDVQMPGLGIRDTIREIHQYCPDTHCVVLTMRDDPVLLRALINDGAAAYVMKFVSMRELLTVIRSVIVSPERIHLSISRDMVKALDPPGSGAPRLSAREIEILCHVAEAHSNAEIARSLFLAETTVKKHLTNIYRKLGATSRMDAIRRAREAGILELCQ